MNYELFTIPDSKPDELTAARSRLARAQSDMKRCEAFHDEHGPEAEPAMNIADREYLDASREAAKLETAAMKNL